jgi:hypothetical protein
MSNRRQCFYGIATGATIVYEKPDRIIVGKYVLSPAYCVFDYGEIVEDNDGILKIVKTYYPLNAQNEQHFFYVHEKDIVQGAM